MPVSEAQSANQPHNTLDDDEMLEHLRELDAEVDGPVTRSVMDERGKFGTTAYADHFGTWGNAKIEAGIEDPHANTAHSPTGLAETAQRYLEHNWRDVAPLLDLHDAYVGDPDEVDADEEGEGFQREDCPPEVRDAWRSFIFVDGFVEKVQRHNDGWYWKLTRPAYEALEAHVEANEEAQERHGEKTPLPCTCYPLAIENHGDTIECHHCKTEYPRDACNTGGRGDD